MKFLRLGELHSALQEMRDLSSDLLGIGRNFRFPYSNDMPTSTLQGLLMANISNPVRRNLRNPIGGICAPDKLSLESPPITTMPEVPVTKHCNSRRLEDDVWLA